MQILTVELLAGLDPDDAHGGALHRLCNGLGIPVVVLLCFRNGLTYRPSIN